MIKSDGCKNNFYIPLKCSDEDEDLKYEVLEVEKNTYITTNIIDDILQYYGESKVAKYIFTILLIFPIYKILFTGKERIFNLKSLTTKNI